MKVVFKVPRIKGLYNNVYELSAFIFKKQKKSIQSCVLDVFYIKNLKEELKACVLIFKANNLVSFLNKEIGIRYYPFRS